MKFKEIKEKWMQADVKAIDKWNSSYHYKGIEEQVDFERHRNALMAEALVILFDKLIDEEENNIKLV